MKQPYMKPMIAVENIAMDRPIALECSADPGIVTSLKALSYLVSGDADCSNGHIIEGGGIDCDFDGNSDYPDDTVCYHSNVQTVLTS